MTLVFMAASAKDLLSVMHTIDNLSDSSSCLKKHGNFCSLQECHDGFCCHCNTRFSLYDFHESGDVLLFLPFIKIPNPPLITCSV